MTEMWPEYSEHDGFFSDEVTSASPRESSLCAFFHGIRGKLNGSAQGKGYARDGGDGTPLYEFVRSHVAGGTDAHAMGEIIYKTVEAAGRPELRANLMLKVAAWAFLVWEADRRSKL